MSGPLTARDGNLVDRLHLPTDHPAFPAISVVITRPPSAYYFVQACYERKPYGRLRVVTAGEDVARDVGQTLLDTLTRCVVCEAWVVHLGGTQWVDVDNHVATATVTWHEHRPTIEEPA